MTNPIYHSFDADGYYTGSAVPPIDPVAGDWAQPSETATAAPVPVFNPETERARWQGGAWAVEIIPVSEPGPEPEPAPDLPPSSCTRRQGRLALRERGDLGAVEAHIAGIADGTERQIAQIEYEADTWERSNPFVQSMWAQLGGTPEQLDDLFRKAVTL